MSIYNPNIPQPNDDLSDSQGQILQNFNKADSSFGTDHYRFSDLTVNNGFHQRVTLPGNATPPTPALNYGAMYGLTQSSVTSPYWRSDGTTTDWPMLPIKAFCEFTFSAPPVITANSFNVSSVTKLGDGNYRVNFTVPFADTNYLVLAQQSAGGGSLGIIAYTAKLTTSVQVNLLKQDGSGFSSAGAAMSVAILRNQ